MDPPKNKNKKKEKENKPKSNRVKHYNKSEREKEILNECYDNWEKEPLNSTKKDQICDEYLTKLKNEGYEYNLEDVKHYCGNRFQAKKRKQRLMEQSKQLQESGNNMLNAPPLSIYQNNLYSQNRQLINPINPNQIKSNNPEYPSQPLPPGQINNLYNPQFPQQNPINQNYPPPPQNTDQQAPFSPNDSSYSLFSPTPSGTIEYPSSDKYFMNTSSLLPEIINPTAEYTENKDEGDETHNSSNINNNLQKDEIAKSATDSSNEEETPQPPENKPNKKSTSQKDNFDDSPFSSTNLALNPLSSTNEDMTEEEFIGSLPEDVPEDSVLDEDQKENLRFLIYKNIQRCFAILHHAHDFYGHPATKTGKITPNRSLLNFESTLEKKFVHFCNTIINVCGVDQVYAVDQGCAVIPMLTKKSAISRTSRIYNNVRYNEISRTPSNSTDIPLASSADYFKEKSSAAMMKMKSESVKKEDNNDIEGLNEMIQINSSSGSNNNASNCDSSSCSVVPLSHSNKMTGLSKKLKIFYNGEYNEELSTSFDVSDVEASAVISLQNDGFNKTELAYVTFDFNSHVLNLMNVKTETGFFFPATSMFFNEERSKLYVCGDVRVKEFNVDVRDEGKIVVKNTRTFYFGKEGARTSAIAFIGNLLVLGFGDTLFMWDVDTEKEAITNKKLLNTKVNKKLAENSGIDLGKVDWTPGIACETSAQIENISQITSLAVLGNEEFLAVSSSSYPVIYVFDKSFACVAKLVSHTMGVTSLRSFGYKLFSGSLDLTARIWDVNIGVPELLVDTRCEKITAIELVNYCGQTFLITGTEEGHVQVISINKKTALYEIRLNKNVVPRNIFGVEENNQNEKGLKLMVVSEFVSPDGEGNIKRFQVQYFNFI